MSNKAHTATLNRICQKLGLQPDPDGRFDIRTNAFIIEVETSATMADGIERLKRQVLPSYIAVTNKEGIQLARKMVVGTAVGVMDPQGNVVVESRLLEDSKAEC